MSNVRIDTTGRLRRVMLPLLLAGTACLVEPALDPMGNGIQDPVFEHVWTVILTDDSGRVWIAQTDAALAASGPRTVEAVPAWFWSDLNGPPDRTDLILWTSLSAGTLEWRLEAGGVPVSWARGPMSVDARHWVPRSRGWATLFWNGRQLAVAYDVIGGMPMPQDPVVDPIPEASIVVQSPGIVSLRLDDCTPGDARSFAVLSRLRLVAEFAVPSSYVDAAPGCSQQFLSTLVANGDMVESHSRFHGRVPMDFGEFYLETVGSARDLQARGFQPHVFIEPGSWHTGGTEPEDLNSLAKLVTPYGALVRRMYVATEAYASSEQQRAIPVRNRIGPLAYPIKDFTAPQIDRLVRGAAQGDRWVEFMWHSWELSAESLEVRLSAIAALRDSGLVTVLPLYTALHATH